MPSHSNRRSTALPIAGHWYRAASCKGQVSRINEQHIHPYWAGTIWVVHGSERDLVVDTGTGIVPLPPFVASLTTRPLLAVALCAYYDHAGGLYAFDERACHRLEVDELAGPEVNDSNFRFTRDNRVTARPDDRYDMENYVMKSVAPTMVLEDGDILDLGNRKLEVLHIPGRTPGSIALWEAQAGFLFGGESLFIDPDKNPFPPRDVARYEASLARLATLPVTTVFGGHYSCFTSSQFQQLVASETGRY